MIRILSSDPNLISSLSNMDFTELMNTISSGGVNVLPDDGNLQGNVSNAISTLDKPAVNGTSGVDPSSISQLSTEVSNNQSSESVPLVKVESSDSVTGNVLLNSLSSTNTQGLQSTESTDDGCESFVATDLLSGAEPDASESDQKSDQLLLDPSGDNVDSVEPEVLNSIIDFDSSEHTSADNPTELVQMTPDNIADGEQGEVTPGNQVIAASNIFQTPEGIIIIQNEDGSTVQLQGAEGEPIPIETIQALLAGDGQILQALGGN